MKKSITEGFIEDLFNMIAKGRVDSKVKKMMKDDPEVAQAVRDVKASFDRLNKAMDKR